MVIITVINPSFLFEEKSFHLKTDPLGTASGINPAKEKFILACGVIVLKEPIPPAISPLEIIPFKGKNEILDLSSEQRFNIYALSIPEVLFNSYNTRYVWKSC